MNRTIYSTIQRDMWDSIAYKVYGNELYMHALIEANQKYRDLSIFPAGIKLNLPKISKGSTRAVPPWKR